MLTCGFVLHVLESILSLIAHMCQVMTGKLGFDLAYQPTRLSFQHSERHGSRYSWNEMRSNFGYAYMEIDGFNDLLCMHKVSEANHVEGSAKGIASACFIFHSWPAPNR